MAIFMAIAITAGFCCVLIIVKALVFISSIVLETVGPCAFGV